MCALKRGVLKEHVIPNCFLSVRAVQAMQRGGGSNPAGNIHVIARPCRAHGCKGVSRRRGLALATLNDMVTLPGHLAAGAIQAPQRGGGAGGGAGDVHGAVAWRRTRLAACIACRPAHAGRGRGGLLKPEPDLTLFCK